ncbi:MAG: cation:proton antiporter, partial [Chloroflexi bacterium]|nr:cation:proton antiporter [Chloroflexota bacterium]
MDTTSFLLPLTVMLIGSQVAAALSHKAKLPTVFGTLMVGLLVGPSVLGWVSDSQSLADLSQIGVLILMFLAGIETDMTAMRKLGTAAFLTAVCGVILPFAGGVGLSMAFGLPLKSSLLIGAILTATSVSITARTLQELGRLQSREGTIILGAAVIDDVLGILVLSAVMSMEGTGEGSWAILKMVLFFPSALALGYFGMPT